MIPYNHITYGEALSRSLRLLENASGRKNFYVSPNSDTLYVLSLRLNEINHPVVVSVETYLFRLYFHYITDFGSITR